jgi:hypothetical protein
MRKVHSTNDKQQPRASKHGPKRHRTFEWPLLIYPMLFLTTLVILYTVHRSIERESFPPLEHPRGAQEPTSAPNHAGPADSSAKLVSGPALQTPELTGTVGIRGDQTMATPDDGPMDQSRRVPSVADTKRRAVDPNQLNGSARIVALLSLAIEGNDHAGIKQCLAELEILGDEAVGPLQEMLATQEGETALWAATTLARIGTLAATGALLDQLAQTGEGAYKEELSKRISIISNHDSWPLLLDIMMEAQDAAVVRAAGASLSGLADAPILDEVIARYATASTEGEIDRLAQLIRTIRSPAASASLLSLAGPASSPPRDSLQDAALEALARIGNAECVSHLFQRLEASPPGQDGPLFNTITRIEAPEAQAALLYAAAGNKEVSAEHGQTAAIYALKNYPDEQTLALLERILAQEQNEKVLSAAARTLDDIRRGPYTVAVNTDALQRSEQMLPLAPVEK